MTTKVPEPGGPLLPVHWRVVLVSPQTAENVGAVARVMKNFGLRDLVLVAPRCQLEGETRATHLARFAEDILNARREVDSLAEALEDMHFAFALTRHASEDRPVDFRGFVPQDLYRRFGGEGHAGALVFGREDHGLTNAECAFCSARWALPTHEEGPSLNLAQAVAVTLAGIAQLAPGGESSRHEADEDEHASMGELDGLMQHVDQVMEASDYERGVPREHPLRLMRRAALRARLTRSEVHAIRGVCRRVLNAILGFERRP